jgi:hypothetical protein
VELISAWDAVEFLSKSAPRPWVKRMLVWMICNYELIPYFTKGQSIARCYALGAILQGLDRGVSIDRARASVKERFSPELAEKILQSGERDYVDYLTYSWDEGNEGPREVSPGYFLRASNVTWVTGVLEAEIGWIGPPIEKSYFLEEEDLLTSEFDDADYKITLTGLCFDRETIELLQPNVELTPVAVGHVETRSRLGRPRTWDWDGAMTYLLTIAQTPDGLPTGPGAQAQIERLVGEWFTNQTGDAPAPSQVRQHAAKIMRALKKPESR